MDVDKSEANVKMQSLPVKKRVAHEAKHTEVHVNNQIEMETKVFFQLFSFFLSLLKSLWVRVDLSPRFWYRCVDQKPQDSPRRRPEYSSERPRCLRQLKVVSCLFPPRVRGNQRPGMRRVPLLKSCSLLIYRTVSTRWLLSPF